MFKAIPSLLDTVEENGAVKKAIESGCLTSGRVKSTDDEFGKGMTFIMQIGQPNAVDPAQAELKDTHGEQFHSDADKQVVEYLTTIEKIDLKNSPIHNPYVVNGPQSGFPMAQKSAAAAAALDDLCKGGIGSGPTTESATPRSRPENISKVGLRYHTAPKQSANVGKDTMKEAEDAVRKQRASTAMAAFAKKSETTMAHRWASLKKRKSKCSAKKSLPLPMDRDGLMAKGLGWDEETA